MFKNYFKLAWRNLLKDKQSTLLNLIGLSTGLASALLIYLWVTDERSVDNFNKNDARLYQVLKNSPNADGTTTTRESTQAFLAKSMAKALPEVEYAVSVRPEEAYIFAANEKHIKARPEFADSDFFKVFSYRLIDGNKSKPLSDKFGVLLSDKLALKLFNTTTGLVGKTLEWKGQSEFDGIYNVAGVFEAPPANATNQFDMLFSYDLFATKESEDMANWGSNGEYTYLLLKDRTDIDGFNRKIKHFTQEKIKSIYKNDQLKYLLPWEGEIFAQRYSERYLHNHYENGVPTGGRIQYVKLFLIIAIFVLIIACINFMNLSTAKASRRIKEVGIRKVVGADRNSLIFQYITESMLMAFISLAIGLLLADLCIPVFREITGKSLSLQLNAEIVSVALFIALLTGLLAGSYPAFYLSGFNPIAVLKGKLNTTSGESWIRKGLVVFQFSISVVLIISVMIVYQQMKLIHTRNLGYDKTNVISFSNEGGFMKDLSPLFISIRKLPGVINVSDASGNFFGSASHGGSGINWDGKDPNLGIEYYGNSVGPDFFETMGLQMAAGRPFSQNFNDSSSVVFNQAAILAMGIKDPIGKMVTLWGQKKQIVGVVKDYHFQSMYKKISPAFLTFSQNNENILVKINSANQAQTISTISKLFAQYYHGLEFNFSFLDEEYNALYASEENVAILSRYFAGITILISCLGLFGLSAFTAQRRQKEIGIRKVIGASISNIAIMLSTDFLKLILVALLIAMPLSWWAANEWLKNFAYRVDVQAGVFVIAIISVLLITLVTISFQTIKAAIVNPVKSLRTE